jgi:hypothetical protein
MEHMEFGEVDGSADINSARYMVKANGGPRPKMSRSFARERGKKLKPHFDAWI